MNHVARFTQGEILIYLEQPSASSKLEVRIMQKAVDVGNSLRSKEVSDEEKVYHPVVG